ncbi:hypothetical protein EVAR_55356_1 [Eumeta japonica]|uniref:Uncharacterized protein n=1 Tax=Eumeta variegata TaxID=151549 RepID=A0A4C1YT25_EUMVA|nr:hypothetical protein EVAR_55356_1 [Eumeta japonica]
MSHLPSISRRPRASPDVAAFQSADGADAGAAPDVTQRRAGRRNSSTSCDVVRHRLANNYAALFVAFDNMRILPAAARSNCGRRLVADYNLRVAGAHVIPREIYVVDGTALARLRDL